MSRCISRVIGGENMLLRMEKKKVARKTPNLLVNKNAQAVLIRNRSIGVSSTSQSKLRAINCNKDARNRHSGIFAMPRAAICIFMLVLRSPYATLPLSRYNESRGWAPRVVLLIFRLIRTSHLGTSCSAISFVPCVISLIVMRLKSSA